MSDWKAAKKPFTKSQKRLRSEIREEFEWTMKIPQTKPHLIKNFGEWKWISDLVRLNNAYKEASESRDELINNHLFLLAALRPNLMNKALRLQNKEITLDSLTDKDKEELQTYLKSANEEGKGVLSR